MAGMTRGRLPARVYWVRRLMLLGVAALLVVGFAQLLGSGGGSGGDRATRVSDTTSPSPSDVGSPSVGSTTGSDPQVGNGKVLPTGPCAADDVLVQPSVPHPVAGGDVKLVLRLSTITSPACDWQLSASTLALTITSGADLIWTSQQCPSSIPSEAMVLRNSAQAKVAVTWNARRSAPGCRAATDWALPGTYHLHAAALAGQPSDSTFLLTTPSPAQVTRTAHPHQSAKERRRARQHALKQERHLHRLLNPSTSPSTSPSSHG
jgi:hypothetical protein